MLRKSTDYLGLSPPGLWEEPATFELGFFTLKRLHLSFSSQLKSMRRTPLGPETTTRSCLMTLQTTTTTLMM